MVSEDVLMVRRWSWLMGLCLAPPKYLVSDLDEVMWGKAGIRADMLRESEPGARFLDGECSEEWVGGCQVGVKELRTLNLGLKMIARLRSLDVHTSLSSSK